MMRIGIGLDSHAIKPDTAKRVAVRKGLILGGVTVSDDFFAIADSDGDVIIHSLCNAFSTAIGGGSLDTWAGKMAKRGITDSRDFLRVIVEKVRNAGYKIENVALMLEGQQPKLEDWREKIQLSLAKLLGIEKTRIGLACTTGQNLTAFGRGEGIQVFSTVLLVNKFFDHHR